MSKDNLLTKSPNGKKWIISQKGEEEFGAYELSYFNRYCGRLRSLFGYLRLLLGHNSCNWHVTEQLEIALKQCKSPLKRSLTHVTSM